MTYKEGGAGFDSGGEWFLLFDLCSWFDDRG